MNKSHMIKLAKFKDMGLLNKFLISDPAWRAKATD